MANTLFYGCLLAALLAVSSVQAQDPRVVPTGYPILTVDGGRIDCFNETLRFGHFRTCELSAGTRRLAGNFAVSSNGVTDGDNVRSELGNAVLQNGFPYRCEPSHIEWDTGGVRTLESRCAFLLDPHRVAVFHFFTEDKRVLMRWRSAEASLIQ